MSSIIEVAIKLLSDRNCSEHELKQQLEKEFSDLTDLDARIASAIIRLRELHLINDNRLAESLAERYEHKGNRFITQTLRQKGVSDEVITEALRSLGDEVTRAIDEARRKHNPDRYDNPEKSKTRIYRFLSGRGFSEDAIDEVVNQLNKEGFFATSEERIFG